MKVNTVTTYIFNKIEIKIRQSNYADYFSLNTRTKSLFYIF